MTRVSSALLFLCALLSGCRTSLDQNQNHVEDLTLLPTLSYLSTPTGIPLLVNSATYIAPAQLSANGGNIISCGILEGSKVLPLGLTVDSKTCVILGTPSGTSALETYTIIAKNSWGSSAPATITLYTVPSAPTLSYSYPTTLVRNAGAVSVFPILFDNGARIQNCQIKPGTTPSSFPGTITLNAQNCSLSGAGAVGAPQVYTITATNSVGSTDALLSLQINGPPQVVYNNPLISAPYVGRSGISLSIQPTIQTNGSPILSCAFKTGSSVPSWASIHPQTCTITGTPSAGMGPLLLNVVATNSSGVSADAPIAIQIEGVPALAYGSATFSGSKNQPFTIIPVLNPNIVSNFVTCQIASDSPTLTLPPNLSLGSGNCVISGTPTGVSAPQTFKIQATNSFGSSPGAWVSFQINDVPSLSYTPNTVTGSVGTPLSLTANLITNGASVTQCTSTPPLPTGLQIHPVTCNITGAPSAVSGSTAYSISATNSSGSSLAASLTLTINAGIPTLKYPATPQYVDRLVNINFSSVPELRDNGSAVTQCQTRAGTLNLPGSMVISPTTCLITGSSPDKSLPIPYTLIAINGVGTSADSPVTIGVRGPPDLAYPPQVNSGILGVPMVISPSVLLNYDAPITGCMIQGGTSLAVPNSSEFSVNPLTCVITVFAQNLPLQDPNNPASGKETSFIVTATNRLGNSAQAPLTIDLAPTAPELNYQTTLTAPAQVRVNDAATFLPPLFNTRGASTTCTIKPSTPLPYGLGIHPSTCGLIGSTPALLPPTAYTVVAQNSIGSTEATLHLQVIANKPTLSYSGSANTAGAYASYMSISPKVFFNNGSLITSCVLAPSSSPLPTGLQVNSDCTVTGVVTGFSSTVLIRATNSVGFVDASLAITVNPTAPTLSYGSGPFNGSLGSALSISPTSLSPGGSPITGCASAPALPTGLSISSTTCVISGTPSATLLSSGTYTINVTNAAGSTGATVNINIAAGKPTIAYSGTLVGTAGTAIAPPLTPTIQENGASVTQCTSNPSLPGGLTFNSSTCEISGTPTGATATTVQITAVNSAGTSAPYGLQITINPVNPTLSYNTVKTNYYTGETISIVPTFVSGGEAITSCSSAPTLPAGLSFETATCRIFGTLTSGVVSPTTYTVTASTATNRTATATLTFGVISQWQDVPAASAPTPRYNHVAVWDDLNNKMIIWGGNSDPNIYLNTGATYDFSSGWTALPTANAPSPRSNASVVWDTLHHEMIVWGGHDATQYFNDGAIYTPGTPGSWRAMTSTGAPSARTYHSAVWTGTKMVIYGGFNGTSIGTGAIYDPGIDDWTAFPTCITGSRYNHSAIWRSGANEMYIWGGQDMSGNLATGFRWNDVAGCVSTLIASVGPDVPIARFNHVAGWLPTAVPAGMMIWGGATSNSSNSVVNTGSIYDPTGNTWSALPTLGAPAARQKHTLIVEPNTHKVLVWGGLSATNAPLGTGAIYDPVAGTWTPMNSSNAPSPRFEHTAIWNTDKSGMLIWGGYDGSNSSTNSGKLYFFR